MTQHLQAIAARRQQAEASDEGLLAFYANALNDVAWLLELADKHEQYLRATCDECAKKGML